MNIKHDYSYITESGKLLIENGLAEQSVYSLNFNRYFSEEEKQENVRMSHQLNSEEWNQRCNERSKDIYNQMLPIIEEINNQFDIHQLNVEKSSYKHYDTNWDLYFHSNKGWNNRDYFDNFQLTFNKKRSITENQILLNKLLDILSNIEVKNVSCRVQYNVVTDDNKIKEVAKEVFEKLQDKTIKFSNMEGKLKLIDNNYAFIKKRAKKSYYRITDMDLCLMQINNITAEAV
jgi:hypothetical protein